jgi:hypothetical protein
MAKVQKTENRAGLNQILKCSKMRALLVRHFVKHTREWKVLSFGIFFNKFLLQASVNTDVHLALWFYLLPHSF